MRHRRGILLALVAVVFASGAGGERRKLAEFWSDPDHPSRRYEKLVVIGISDDQQIRHRFENKFVTHLRARQRDGQTSYSLVPDLSVVQSRTPPTSIMRSVTRSSAAPDRRRTRRRASRAASWRNSSS